MTYYLKCKCPEADIPLFYVQLQLKNKTKNCKISLSLNQFKLISL